MSWRKRATNISARTCCAAAAGVVALVERAGQRRRSSGCSSAPHLGVQRFDGGQVVGASSSASRQAICCIRKSAGIAVLFSASTGAPRSSHR